LTNHGNAWAKERRPELIQEFGGKCESCGSTLELQFAHVKETEAFGWSRGRKERLTDISQHRDSYLLLCEVPCHEILTQVERVIGGLAGSRELGLMFIKTRLGENGRSRQAKAALAMSK